MSKDHAKDINELMVHNDPNRLMRFLDIFMTQSFEIKEQLERYIENPDPKYAQSIYYKMSAHTRLMQAAHRKFYTDTHKNWHHR